MVVQISIGNQSMNIRQAYDYLRRSNMDGDFKKKGGEIVDHGTKGISEKDLTGVGVYNPCRDLITLKINGQVQEFKWGDMDKRGEGLFIDYNEFKRAVEKKAKEPAKEPASEISGPKKNSVKEVCVQETYDKRLNRVQSRLKTHYGSLLRGLSSRGESERPAVELKITLYRDKPPLVSLEKDESKSHDWNWGISLQGIAKNELESFRTPVDQDFSWTFN